LLEVYRYNSWVDVKYLTQSASNLNRTQISTDGIASIEVEYSNLNLYGFITEDVLSSESTFRNSWSLSETEYSLGTKYKIYEDFLGSISEFNEPFDSSGDMSNFYNNGWTLSITQDYEILRTDEKLRLINSQPFSITKLDNTNISIDRRRYSKVEWDLEYNSPVDTLALNVDIPFIFFFNNTYSNLNTLNNPLFPISDWVFHTRTEDVKKYEYFYNRNSLDMFLIDVDGFSASFDNIKFYEVDMIPFFQYLTFDYVNKAVQVPFQGIAPEIDYEDSAFSFVSNIDIQLDSLSTQQTVNVPTSTGGGTFPTLVTSFTVI
jgi:hypothetical protein